MGHEETFPVEDYDHLSADTLPHAIRHLDLGGVRRLLEYESEHADRPHIKQILGTRMSELESGAVPAQGAPPPGPQASSPPSDTQRVGPGSQGPPTHAPPHGVPTSPRKPRQGPSPG